MKFRVLIIDHSLTQSDEVKTIFTQSGLVDRIYEAHNGAEGLRIIKNEEVDLVICNPSLPDMDGLNFLREFRALPDQPHLPVLLVSSRAEIDYKAKAFELGAQEFLIRPFQPDDLLMRAKSLIHLKKTYEELHRQIRDLEKTANVDPLTGVFNRKYFIEMMKSELGRSRRHRYTIACLMIDIDNFKTVNDSLGHSVGDHLLKELAQRLNQHMRGYDFTSRYGGDEFVVLLPQSSKGGSLALAERLRHTVDSEPFLKAEGRNIRLSISIGIAAFSGLEVSSEEELVTTSDRALYEAKQRGRNCIAVAESLDQFRVEPPKGLYRRNYRKHQRYPFLTTVKLIHQESKHSTVGYTINISYGGMAMYVQKPVAEESQVEVWVPFIDSTGKPHGESVKGTVRWVRQFNDHYGVGLEFEELNRRDHPIILNFIQEAERLSP